VNGERLGFRGYAEGLAAVVEAFPDYHWDLRHLLVDGCWLSAHWVDTGTTPAGRFVSTQEFAMYRVAGSRIVEVWGDLDRARLCPRAPLRKRRSVGKCGPTGLQIFLDGSKQH